jgi:hypothetical protein
MSSQTKTPETLTAAARAAQLSISAQGQAAQSAGNKLSASDARARLALTTERPGNAAADLRVGDELDGSTMVLPVDAIHTYDRNPRLRENPKYLSIKESVRAQGGVTNQLTVTKRPGDAFYIPFGGGNTRVLVTQELWQETQDPKFKHLTVVYRKWRGDAANIAAHLAENNNRGDTSFWETAHGLWELKQELERELGRVLSATELLWSPLSIELCFRDAAFEIDGVMRLERAQATMNQTLIRGLVTSTSSIRRGPASL